MAADPTEEFGINRLDALIADDPTSESWSFSAHERGALHEAERVMTLEGAAEEAIVAAKRGPRSIVSIRQKSAPSHAETSCPGTEELCRFVRLLNVINTRVRGSTDVWGIKSVNPFLTPIPSPCALAVSLGKSAF